MGKLLPVLLALTGLGSGLAAGYLLRPPPEAAAASDAHAPEPAADAHGAAAADCVVPEGHAAEATLPDPHDPQTAPVYVKLANQFVVPLMGPNSVESTVILSLSLEVPEGAQEAVYNLEPRLRDAFLRVLFDHANAGGFDGNFLNTAGLDDLRKALRETAATAAGPLVEDVLIVDLVKQQV